jgi:signal transduction histidine kinase
VILPSTFDANARVPAPAHPLPLDNRTLSQILDAIPIGVVVVDLSGTPCYANDAARELLGVGADLDARLGDISDVYQVLVAGTEEPYPTDLLPTTLAINGKRSHVDDIEVRAPHGTTEMEVWGTPVIDEDGHTTHGIAIFADIGARRRTETALITRAEERDELNVELQRSNAELDRFAHVASHDLSEPLRSISGFVQLLARRYEDELDADAHHFIQRVVDGTERMHNLIADVLAYSRVGRRTEQFAAVDCDDLMANTILTLQATLTERDSDVVVGPLPVVVGDASQLSQVFQNLVTNAVKFSAEGVRPRVEVTASRIGEFFEFSVKDNGIGIEPQYRHRIFGMFQRLNKREDYGGTGIGLAICEKVVEFHGGKIWVTDSDGAGTDFRFTLPVRQGHDA